MKKNKYKKEQISKGKKRKKKKQRNEIINSINTQKID